MIIIINLVYYVNSNIKLEELYTQTSSPRWMVGAKATIIMYTMHDIICIALPRDSPL